MFVLNFCLVLLERPFFASLQGEGTPLPKPDKKSASANPVENRAISVEMDAKADAADFLTISNREIFDIVTGG